MPASLLFTTAIVAAVLYLPRTNSAPRWNRSIRKTLPVALFALAALMDDAPYLLAIALALSAIGDFALSRPGHRAFLIGMVAFALAHLGFIGVMWPLAQFSTNLIIPAIIMLLLGLSTERWLAPHTHDLRWPVRAYILVIIAMGLTVLGLYQTHPLALFGGLAFVMSDLVLSLETFVIAKTHPLRASAGKIVWITYIIAQACLLLGLGV